jgi:hypothetical protein
LYELDYVASDAALTFIANQVMELSGSRAAVRYISSPTASGKTSSVLPAFLKSTTMESGGTHYIYLAISNNAGRSFKVSGESRIPKGDPNIAMMQGAAFIFQCVKNLFERPNDRTGYLIEIVQTPPDDVETTSIYLQSYLDAKLGS